jgi:uncharacterized protein YqeY
MSLLEKINENLKEALRNKDQKTLSSLRMLLSSIKNKKIELGKDPSDSEIELIVSKEIKQRKDSIIEFEKGGRNDLSKIELEEIQILTNYLPKQLDENEIKKLIKKTIAEVGANSMTDIGKVMGKLMPKVQGKADGSLVNSLVKKELEK